MEEFTIEFLNRNYADRDQQLQWSAKRNWHFGGDRLQIIMQLKDVMAGLDRVLPRSRHILRCCRKAWITESSPVKDDFG